MIKKTIATILAAYMIFGGFTGGHVSAEPNNDKQILPIIVNGQKVKFPDTEPYINTDGRTMVPVRFVTEKLGADVKWDNATQTAIIKYEGNMIHMPIGSNTVSIDGDSLELDTSAEKYEGRTMVPLRFLSEVMNSEVKWDNDAHSVRVTDAEYQAKVDAGEVKLDPWGREYSKTWDANWMKLTDLEGSNFYNFYNTEKSREFIDMVGLEWYKGYADVWGKKIRNWYEVQLNVDYRTIDEKKYVQAFMDNAAPTITMTGYEKYQMTVILQRYVAWVKENKVIVKGYADPELSSAYSSGNLNWVPTHFKFMIISADDTAQTFVDNWEVTSGSDSFKLKKGVWYDGYASVSLDTNVANSKYGTSYGIRSAENMFFKGSYFYDILE